jgi:hypothetical protein
VISALQLDLRSLRNDDPEMGHAHGGGIHHW